MKTREELNALKEEVEALSKKLNELTEDELKEVTGGSHDGILVSPGTMIHAPTFGAVEDTAPYGDTGLSSGIIKVD